MELTASYGDDPSTIQRLAVATEQPALGVRAVRVGGEVDMATAGQFAACLAAGLEDGAAHLIVDLSGVGFLSSAGIVVLIELADRSAAEGVSLHLTGLEPGGAVHRVLAISGVLPLFNVAETVADVLRGLPPE